MAVLVPADWKPSMESPNTSRNRSPAGAPQTPPPNGVQPNPNQGPFNPAQPAWTPSPTAQPFYPQFYPQNTGASPSHSPQIPPGQGPPGQGGPPPPQPQFMPGPHPGMGGPMPGPYFDPNANAQFAQWYHHMMLAQQQATMQAQMGGYPAPMPMQAGYPYPNGPQPGVPVPPFIAPQASRSNSHNSPQEYTGFHPYRRPTRGQSQDSMASAAASQQPGAPFPGVAPGMNGSAPIFQPPYARPDAAGSTSSVGSRPRTDSNRSANSGSGATRRSPAPPPPVPTPPPGRTGTPPQAAQAPSSAASKLAQTQGAHARQSSTASSATSKGPTSSKAPSSSSSTTATAPSSIAPTAAARTPRPSPLSQGQSGGPERELTKAEKRMSRDDSDLAALRDPSAGGRSAGLKGRLRKAFTTLQEEEKEVNERERLSQSSAGGGGANASNNQNVIPPRAPTPAPGPSMARSMSTPAIVDMDSGLGVDGKKKRSIFNSKFNRSTDNISISSVSSSASVMIRKLGSLGKLARRNSIAGITSLFKKDKDGDGDDDGEGGKSGKKDKKKDKKDKDKKGKGAVAEAQVSHATAELESGEWSAEMTGLSPAARLARQHTLKSNAEAAARAKEAEAAALAEKERAAAAQGNGVPVWDRNTATRAQAEGLKRVGEDGRHDDSYNSDDDDGTEEGMYKPGGQPVHEYAADAWDDQDDDHSWAEAEVEGDDTIRQGLARVSIDDRSAFNHAADPHDWPVDEEPWAVGLRRSVERSAVPLRGILKNADNYDQQAYLEQATGGGLTARHRSNSYGGMTGVMGAQPEPGPLARIPSPDPDHIDGLQRVGSVSSGGHHSTHAAPNPVNGESPPFLPAFAFEGGESSPVTASPTTSSQTMVAPPTPEKSIYNLPNSSAPVLTQFSGAPAPLLTHRAVTAPPKKLSFAANLSVYDTFPATLYDRRSEPATASRLTPALAQRIKEELNSFKMEEMEVHAASRIHTQFFV